MSRIPSASAPSSASNHAPQNEWAVASNTWSTCENAPNGPKIGLQSPQNQSATDADHGAQGVVAQGDRCANQADDESWRVAAEQRFLELRAQRLAREAAEKVPPQSDEHAAPQIVIPSSSEMEARRRRGRPKVINEEMRHKIVALLGAGASLTQTAAFVGVGRNTITRALESDEEFAQQVHEARQRVSLFPLNCLLREAVKNWRAAAWLLGYLDRKEHQERTRRQRVFDAADEQIDRDLVQEMREQARRQRQAEASRAGDGEQPPTSARQPRQKQPRSTRLTTDSSPSMSQGDSDM